MPGALFTIARHPRLVAYAGGEVADKQPDGQHHAKGQQILHVRNRQRAARRDKKQVEADHVNHRRQYRRPAAVQKGDNHHAEQVQHHQVGGLKGHQPLHGDDGNNRAQGDGDDAPLEL